jgi:hypothetical protein
VHITTTKSAAGTKFIGAIAMLFIYPSIAVASELGKYRFAERSMSGEMVITEISSCKIKNELGCLSSRVLEIKVQSVNSSTYHTCDFEGFEVTAARISSTRSIETVFRSNDNEDTLDVVFSGDGARIKNGGNSSCGVSGLLVGKWVKSTRTGASKASGRGR